MGRSVNTDETDLIVLVLISPQMYIDRFTLMLCLHNQFQGLSLLYQNLSMINNRYRLRERMSLLKPRVMFHQFTFQTTGQLPIHLAASGGHLQLVELLLERGTPVLDEDKDGNNPLQLACINGHRPIVELLKAKLPLSTVSLKVCIKNDILFTPRARVKNYSCHCKYLK